MMEKGEEESVLTNTMDKTLNEDINFCWTLFSSAGLSSGGCTMVGCAAYEDFWKKFKLESLPTPPSSPVHEAQCGDKELESKLASSLDCDTVTPTETTTTTTPTFTPPSDSESDVFEPGVCCSLHRNLQNNLIKDCMWSDTAPGLSANRIVLDNSSRQSDSFTYFNTIDDSSSSTNRLNLDIKTKDCVDPAFVFPCQTSRCSSRNASPYTANSALSFQGDYDLGLDTPSASSDSSDEEIDVVTVAEKKQRALGNITSITSTPSVKLPTTNPHRSTNNKSKKIGVSTKVSSSSALYQSSRPVSLNGLSRYKPSDTVKKSALQNSHSFSTTLPAASSASAQVAAMHNYSSNVSSKVLHHSNKTPHSYSAPQTPSSSYNSASSSHYTNKRKSSHISSSSYPGSPQNGGGGSSSKKQKHMTEADLKTVSKKLSKGGRTNTGNANNHHHASNSNNASDVEDNTEQGKRAYHNVLERKRREDLRTWFHVLRDSVPEICHNEKAPKMMILNKAVDYILAMVGVSAHADRTISRLKARNQALKQRLQMLRNEVETI